MLYRDQQQSLVKQLTNEARKGVSIVPMQADFRYDKKLCLTSVVFIPADLAKKIQRTIIESLRVVDPHHHYYEPGEMHLTIKNIRTIHDPPLFEDADIQKVDRIFTQIFPKHRSFSFFLEEVVLFPTSVSLIGYCDERLKHLVRDLDTGLKRIGIPDNKKYISDSVFFGNITLCRLVRPPSSAFQRRLEELSCNSIASIDVKEIHLVVCNSVCARDSQRIVNSYKLGSLSGES